MLCCEALEAAEQLLIRSPNANCQLLPHVEALVAGLLDIQVTFLAVIFGSEALAEGC